MKIVFLGNSSELSTEALGILTEMIGNSTHELFIGNNGEKFYNFPNEYDLGVGFLYQYLIPAEQLGKATWINFHPGPLPKYGGRNLSYHAIMNGDEKFGATIHYMDEKFDTGPIIEVIEFNIGDKTAEEIYKISSDKLKILLHKYLPEIIAGEQLESSEQENITYYKKTSISDFIIVCEDVKKEIRAKTFPPYYPKIKIGEQIFKIIPEGD